ncbi:lysozyme-like protein, partial [Rhizoclosmatium globosum]
ACVRNIALKLTSVYETSSQDLQWDVCVTLADNHGYSAGIIQFTTGTGSAQAVISKYETSLQKGTTVQQKSPFKSFDSVLSSLKDASEASGSPQGDISGLQGFCDAWKQASGTPEFRDAQLQVLDDLYWTPSQITARKYSLSLPISIGQIFDSTIQLGAQGTLSLIKSIPTPSGDETKWIGDFLDARRSKLIDMGGAY